MRLTIRGMCIYILHLFYGLSLFKNNFLKNILHMHFRMPCNVKQSEHMNTPFFPRKNAYVTTTWHIARCPPPWRSKRIHAHIIQDPDPDLGTREFECSGINAALMRHIFACVYWWTISINPHHVYLQKYVGWFLLIVRAYEINVGESD